MFCGTAYRKAKASGVIFLYIPTQKNRNVEIVLQINFVCDNSFFFTNRDFLPQNYDTRASDYKGVCALRR